MHLVHVRKETSAVVQVTSGDCEVSSSAEQTFGQWKGSFVSAPCCIIVVTKKKAQQIAAAFHDAFIQLIVFYPFDGYYSSFI